MNFKEDIVSYNSLNYLMPCILLVSSSEVKLNFSLLFSFSFYSLWHKAKVGIKPTTQDEQLIQVNVFKILYIIKNVISSNQPSTYKGEIVSKPHPRSSVVSHTLNETQTFKR